jgi:hypothetical protein
MPYIKGIHYLGILLLPSLTVVFIRLFFRSRVLPRRTVMLTATGSALIVVAMVLKRTAAGATLSLTGIF